MSSNSLQNSQRLITTMDGCFCRTGPYSATDKPNLLCYNVISVPAFVPALSRLTVSPTYFHYQACFVSICHAVCILQSIANPIYHGTLLTPRKVTKSSTIISADLIMQKFFCDCAFEPNVRHYADQKDLPGHVRSSMQAFLSLASMLWQF